jgi:hypothetical protein
MPERWFKGWQEYYQAEPWGEERADLRQLANQITWSAMLVGTEKKLPNPFHPYFEDDTNPEELLRAIEATDARLEPKPGGGYQWKVNSGDDNRQTQLSG